MKQSIARIVGAMTPEEKVDLLSGKGLWRTCAFPQYDIDDYVMTDGTYGVRYSTSQIDHGGNWNIRDFISVMHRNAGDVSNGQENDAPKAPGGSEALFDKSRPATCFPNGSSVACSWDMELMYAMGRALARECLDMGVSLLLGPGINIRRTPLAGRGYEYYSEDPVLSGELAGALINGLQGEGVGASLKHFACNNSEYRRTEMDSVVDERALREIYLAGFKRAIDRSTPWTVMSSYNLLNGVQTSHNPWLLTEVLRDEWGYDGLVMSDWYGIKDRPASLLAGNDLAMPECARDKKELLGAIKAGEIPTDILDRSCTHMLELIEKMTRGRKPGFKADFGAHHRLAQQLATESLVLLKNDGNILPILSTGPDRVKRVAVLGLPAQEPVIQGSGCATTAPFMLDRPLDEIFDLAGETFDIRYAPGVGVNGENDSQALEKAVETAKTADVAVLFVSTAVGEDGENGDRHDLAILPAHEALIHAVAAEQPNLVVVLANSDAVVMPWRDKAKGILETFFAGQGMGRAVADVLFGRANPCGKLTVTMPNCLEETPAYLTYPGENLRHRYSEGLYVGYRYYDKRRIKPLYPFGFGLSYTSFDYAKMALAPAVLTPGQGFTASLDVTNTGARQGKEIVQLYIAPPAGALAREVQALKAFAKVDLGPGETKRVSLAVSWDDLALYDPADAAWVVDNGEYEIRIGKSSRDIVLRETLTVRGTPRYPRIREDSSVVQLIQNPPIFEKIIDLVTRKSGSDREFARKRLTEIAPELFCGLYIALTELMELDISRAEIVEALKEDDAGGA